MPKFKSAMNSISSFQDGLPSVNTLIIIASSAWVLKFILANMMHLIFIMVEYLNTSLDGSSLLHSRLCQKYAARMRRELLLGLQMTPRHASCQDSGPGMSILTLLNKVRRSGTAIFPSFANRAYWYNYVFVCHRARVAQPFGVHTSTRWVTSVWGHLPSS